EIFPLTEVQERLGVPFHLQLAAPGLTADDFERLKALLEAHPGPCPAVLHLVVPNRSETILALPDNLCVKPGAPLEAALEQEMGATFPGREAGPELAAGSVIDPAEAAALEELAGYDPYATGEGSPGDSEPAHPHG
ncbi:MAG: hypothetical protein ACE5FC_01045, partial [Myxococcota bacterium]